MPIFTIYFYYFCSYSFFENYIHSTVFSLIRFKDSWNPKKKKYNHENCPPNGNHKIIYIYKLMVQFWLYLGTKFVKRFVIFVTPPRIYPPWHKFYMTFNMQYPYIYSIHCVLSCDVQFVRFVTSVTLTFSIGYLTLVRFIYIFSVIQYVIIIGYKEIRI